GRPRGPVWLSLRSRWGRVLRTSRENPRRGVPGPFYGTLEGAMGGASAITTANLLQDWHADRPPTAPGWRHLLTAQWPALLHGARSAIAVVVVLQVWLLIDLPQLTEMAVTVAVVMSAPVIADGSIGTRHAVAQRALHRFMGCLLGGLVALGCLALNVTSFLWWLAMIGAAVWIGMHIQLGKHGVGYVGTQAAFVFVVTLVQGAQPPDSIMPGLDRFIGITAGVWVPLVGSLLLL